VNVPTPNGPTCVQPAKPAEKSPFVIHGVGIGVGGISVGVGVGGISVNLQAVAGKANVSIRLNKTQSIFFLDIFDPRRIICCRGAGPSPT
jgi:hypothetical protein